MWILTIIIVCIFLVRQIIRIIFLRWIHQKKANTYVYRFKYRIFMIEHPILSKILWVVIIISIINIIIICINFITKNNIGKDNFKITKEKRMHDNENTIHTYKFIIENTTWYDSYQKCLNDNAHLLSIDSDEEYNYVINEIESNGLNKYHFYIGAYRPKNESNYYWIDSNGYLKKKVINNIPYWMTNEPSFKDSTLDIDENYSVLFYYHKEEKWVINDIPNDIIKAIPTYQDYVGYICEYE